MTVRTLLVVPTDLAGPKIGGIQSFVKGFVKYAPDDFELEHLGTSTDPSARPVGRWQRIEIDGRSIRILPVVNESRVNERDHIPVALRFTAGLMRYRRRYSRLGRVLQFHRAGAPLSFMFDSHPKIQVVHLDVTDLFHGRSGSRWRLLPGLHQRIEDCTLASMQRIFVVNEAGANAYRRRRPDLAARIEFLPTWVDDEIFIPSTEGRRAQIRAAVRSELTISRDASLLLFAGRLELQKDPVLLLRAFARCARGMPAARLVLAGDGALRAECKAVASALDIAGKVRFLGVRSRPEVARLMCAADALVLASAFEGMPISVIEALSMGVPVVAPAVGEIPRLVKTGCTGWLAQRTAEALAAGMVWAIRQGEGASLRQACLAAAAPYRARQVLRDFYDVHRRLSR
jgi:glycosyltransferase involved in cell wall biosynthesis